MPIPTIVDPTLFDGYSEGDPVQSNRLRAAVTIMVAGQDVTSKLNPYLISVRCLVGSRLEEYQLELELDDRDAELQIPPIDSPIKCFFGWVGQSSNTLVWDGVIHDIEYSFDRKSGGRKMFIHGFGGNFLDHGKTPATFVTGAGSSDEEVETGPQIPLNVPLQKAAGFAKQTITVNPHLKSKTQDHWDQHNESYYQFAKRVIEDAGGLFRVTKGVFGEAMWQGEDGDGNPFPTIPCIWAKNLISLRVRPFAARPMWKSSTSHFFDTPNSQWKMIRSMSSGMQQAMANADFTTPNPAPNALASQQDTSGAMDGTLAYQGPGKIVINGEPNATGNGYANIINVRPGVDGLYWIETAEHIYSRSGYVTWLDVQAQTISGSGSARPSYSRYIPPPADAAALAAAVAAQAARTAAEEAAALAVTVPLDGE